MQAEGQRVGSGPHRSGVGQRPGGPSSPPGARDGGNHTDIRGVPMWLLRSALEFDSRSEQENEDGPPLRMSQWLLRLVFQCIICTGIPFYI